MEIDDDEPIAVSAQAPPSLPARPQSIAQSPPESPTPPSPAVAPGPAAALAGVMAGRAAAPTPNSPSPPPPQPTQQSSSSQYDDYHHASDEEPAIRSPALPSRPRPQQQPPPPQLQPEPSYEYSSPQQSPRVEDSSAEAYRTPGGFHMYNINEMVSVMGKRKKMPTTLGINVRVGTILIAPEKATDGPSMEWTADKMTHYSREGKHVFMELVRPSKSIDFHAGARDTAEEIIMMLGEMAGAMRAEGLREVIMAGTKRSVRKGKILYEFMAQGQDEVTVDAGDEVIILDDSRSEDWWQVRRLRTGKEGVVPSSYVEITGTMSPPPGSSGAKSHIDQSRAEDIRLHKEALKASKDNDQVGPGKRLPQRGSSLVANDNDNDSAQQRNRRENGRSDQSRPKSSKFLLLDIPTRILPANSIFQILTEPDSSKVRTWTDRSKSFSVEAQFLGLKDGKIHLHKMNGVKIAVPITKMSREDLEHVESATGLSLSTEKPPSDNRKPRTSSHPSGSNSSTTAPKEDQKPEYDWFQFFLSCDVAVGLCERYAQAFTKDSMDESVLPDVDASVLRTLGLREGDIIKVMRYLDGKFGREKNKDGDGGLFSGPGGTLRNNTRKGRPAPAVQTSDIVDASAFSTKKDMTGSSDEVPSSTATPASPKKATVLQEPESSTANGFDDDAWDVKPSKQAQTKAQSPIPATAKPSSPSHTLTGSMQDLSLLTEPLQPAKTATALPSVPASAVPPPSADSTYAPTVTAQQQMPGATPSFFSGVAQSRQRPQPPQTTSPPQGSLVPPPPTRPLSAPQSAQPSAFQGPGLVSQMTGVQGQPAAPGTSLNEISQARLQQQQYAAHMQQPIMTGYAGMQSQGMAPYQTAMQTGVPGQFIQPMMTGAPMPSQSPFSDAARQSFTAMQQQPTGFTASFAQQQQPGFGQQSQSGVNNFLPPALEPQRTGFPQQPAQPLVPQQTGPPPSVRFGVQNEPKKLAPQPTGRRANLAQASKIFPLLLYNIVGSPFQQLPTILLVSNGHCHRNCL